MSKCYSRHTMGQDWGGRRRLNPQDCPRVTKKQALRMAAAFGMKLRRVIWYSQYGSMFYSDWGWWQYEKSPGEWVGLGDTNYLAMQEMKRLQEKKATTK